MRLNPSIHIPFIGIFGGFGFAAGIAVTTIVVRQRHMSMTLLLIIGALLAVSFFLHALIKKRITGKESYVLYHDLIRSLLIVILAALVAGTPILPWLDVFCIGFGTFHFFGRIGCFFGGCCHGKICAAGIRYGDNYRDAGLPFYYVNRRLFPAQLAEAFVLLLLTGGCLMMMQQQATSGLVFAVYITGYACARYLLEFFRGDLDRPFLLGFSEAQWISAALLLCVALFSRSAQLPVSSFFFGAMTLVLFSALFLFFLRKNFTEWELLLPHHVHELITIAENAIDGSNRNQKVVLRNTSRGISLSLSPLITAEQSGWHLAFSVSDNNRREQRIKKAFAIVHKNRFPQHTSRFIADRNGVMHFQLFPNP